MRGGSVFGGWSVRQRRTTSFFLLKICFRFFCFILFQDLLSGFWKILMMLVEEAAWGGRSVRQRGTTSFFLLFV